MQGRLRRLAPVAVGLSVLSLAAVLAYSQARQDTDVLGTLRGLDLRFVAAAVGFHVASHLAWTLRIAVLARGLGVPLRPLAAFRLVLAGQFAGAVTPARAGAEAMRLTLLVRGGARGVTAGRTVLADRASDLVFFATLGTLGALGLGTVFGTGAVALRGLAFLAAATLLAFITVLVVGLRRPEVVAGGAERAWNGLRRLVRRPPTALRTPVSSFLADVREGVVSLARESPWRLVVAAGLSVAVWSLEYGVLWVLLRGLGIDMPLVAVLAAGVLLTMLAALPISVGGAGVSEVAAVLLLGPWAGGLAPVVVLLWRASSYYYDVALGGLVAAWSLPRRTAPAATLQ